MRAIEISDNSQRKADFDIKFVKVWQTSRSVAEVAEKLGINYFAATGRASRLRKMNVPLKLLTKQTGPKRVVDVEGLRKIAKQLA